MQPSSGAVIVRMGQAKVDHTGEYKLVADNGHGKDEGSLRHQYQYKYKYKYKAKVDYTGEYKLVADNGHGKDEVSTCHQKQWVSAAWTRMTNSLFYLFVSYYV